MKEGQVEAKGTAAPRRRQFKSSQPPESSLNPQDGDDDDEWDGQYGQYGQFGQYIRPDDWYEWDIKGVAPQFIW